MTVKKMLKNPSIAVGAFIIFFFIFMAIFAPLISPHAPDKIYDQSLRLDPFWSEGNFHFIFGTDDVGRDILSRLIYGSRISLLVGFLVGNQYC